MKCCRLCLLWLKRQESWKLNNHQNFVLINLANKHSIKMEMKTGNQIVWGGNTRTPAPISISHSTSYIVSISTVVFPVYWITKLLWKQSLVWINTYYLLSDCKHWSHQATCDIHYQNWLIVLVIQISDRSRFQLQIYFSMNALWHEWNIISNPSHLSSVLIICWCHLV